MRLLDRSWMTIDEEYRPDVRLTEAVGAELRRIKLDTYNGIYTLRITLDQVDPNPVEPDEDDV